MTDQTEPKYKIGDWVEYECGYDENDNIITHVDQILDTDDIEEFAENMQYYTKDLALYESDILHAVAIHPIEHHKCKDCEHMIEVGDYEGQPNYEVTQDCPAFRWIYQFWNDNNDTGGMVTLSPPDCTNCFKPRHVGETDFIDIKETSDNASVQREGQS